MNNIKDNQQLKGRVRSKVATKGRQGLVSNGQQSSGRIGRHLYPSLTLPLKSHRPMKMREKRGKMVARKNQILTLSGVKRRKPEAKRREDRGRLKWNQ